MLHFWLIFREFYDLDSGIAGGVVAAPYFQEYFNLTNSDGTKNTVKVNMVSSNVVSVLQAGAFFGALGSAPISGLSFSPSSHLPFTIFGAFHYQSQDWTEKDPDFFQCNPCYWRGVY